MTLYATTPFDGLMWRSQQSCCFNVLTRALKKESPVQTLLLVIRGLFGLVLMYQSALLNPKRKKHILVK